MTPSEARLFRDIAQSRSISRAAALNEITQSAASQQVKDLERRLGADLLDRSTRPVALTAAGELYAELCRDWLKRYAGFELDLERLKNTVEGTVRVASIYSIGLSEISRLQEEFARRFPAAILRVDYMRPDKVHEAVLADRADIGLVSYPEENKELKKIDWREEVMAVVAPPGHRLTRRKRLSPKDLDGQDFVGFDEDLTIRREMDRYLREHGVRVRIAMHFDNVQMIKEAVALGSGISILPLRTMEAEVRQKRLVAIPLNGSRLVRPVGILHLRGKTFNRAIQAFLSLLDEPAD